MGGMTNRFFASMRPIRPGLKSESSAGMGQLLGRGGCATRNHPVGCNLHTIRPATRVAQRGAAEPGARIHAARAFLVRPDARFTTTHRPPGRLRDDARSTPRRHIGDRADTPRHVLATRGHAVLSPDAPLREGRTMADIAATVMPGVDTAIEWGYADRDRLAVMGRSYGAYSTLSLITQTSLLDRPSPRTGTHSSQIPSPSRRPKCVCIALHSLR